MTTAEQVADSLQYLFHRPSESLLYSKGNVIFILPHTYWNSGQTFSASLSQFRSQLVRRRRQIKVRPYGMPDISFAELLDRKVNFTIFNCFHQECAKQLINMLLHMPGIHQFLSACAYFRERVNPFLFIYAASVAMLRREDTKGIPFPTHVECFPELYLNGCIFNGIRNIASITPARRVPIEVPFQYDEIGGDPENRLVYWREDVGINLWHWNWYIVNPNQAFEIDVNYQRGEHFIYTYEQLLARYNFERLCNGLSRVEIMPQVNCRLPQGYVSNLHNRTVGVPWPMRRQDSSLKNVSRRNEFVHVSFEILELWLLRLHEAMHGGTRFPYIDDHISPPVKLEALGNMIEFNRLNINPAYYGPLRMKMLMMLGYINDPDGEKKEPYGNICDPATSLRDPAFYRWHAALDRIVQKQKSKLPAYTLQEKTFQNDVAEVQIISVEVITDKCIRSDEFRTFWQRSNIDLSKGLNFKIRGPLYARVTHLQHTPFTYRIQVKNPGPQHTSMVRIFLSPKFNENGGRFNFEQQRLLFVEQDSFITELMNGMNTIERRSKESTVTMSRKDVFPSHTVNAESFRNRNFLGWPEYMLIPKGTSEGFPCQLFIIITSAKHDSKFEGNPVRKHILNKNKFDDGRSFGFPFDRPAPDVNKLSQFLTSNMFVIDTFIRFTAANPES